MRKLVYFIATTIDGFIAREDGSYDFFPMVGDHLTYIRDEYPETMPTHVQQLLGMSSANRHFDTVIQGRYTYEVALNEGITSPYAHLRQFVVSSSMATSPDPAVTLIQSDALGLVRELKQEDGLDIWLCGGGSLAGSLLNEIDELVLKINPVALGQGKSLFHGIEQPLPLELIDHQVFAGGVAIHRYALTKPS